LGLAGCGKNQPPKEPGSPAADGAGPHAPALAESASAAPAPPSGPLSHGIAAGTVIEVRLRSFIDSSFTRPGFVGGTVETDVKGSDGGLAIPAGSAVTIYLRLLSQKGPISRVEMGLYAIHIGTHEFSLTSGSTDAASLVFTDDAGKGASHSSVHVPYGTILQFKLDRAVQLQ